MQQKNEREYPSERFPQENESVLHAFAVQNIDGIALINEAGIIVEWNRVMEEVTGLSAQDTLGTSIWNTQLLLVSEELRTSDRSEHYREVFQEMIHSGIVPERIASNVSQVYRSDGREVFAEQKIFCIKAGDVNLLGAVVRDVTDRKKVDEKIRRQAARAEVLGALSQVLTRVSHDYQLVLDTVVQRCAELIGDGASIFLYSPEQEFLELAAVYNADPNAVEIFRAEMQARPIRADEGAYAKAIGEQQPVLIESIPAEFLTSPERREYYQKLPIYSMMLAPLLTHGKVLGCIGLARHAPKKNYSSEDLVFLQDIADRSALAVLNAQIYKAREQELAERKQAQDDLSRRAEQLATIVEIGHAVSTLQDLDAVLEIIHRQIQRIAPVDALFVCLWDEDKKRLTFPLTYDLGVRYDQPDAPLRQNTPFAYVIQNGKPYCLHRTPEEIAELENTPGDVGNSKLRSKSLLYVPLWQASRVIGAFSIQSYSYNSYPDELIETVAAIGDQAAIAIQNARLFMNIQKELAERKLVEQALRFSEEKFSKSFHTTQVLMTIEDANHVIIDVNRAFLETFGLEREEVVGKTILDLNILYNPADLALLRREYEQKGCLKDFEVHIRNKKGESGFALLSSDNFYMDDTLYTLTSGLDITTRKQAETKLHNSETLYRRAINAAGAVPYYLDARTNTYTFMGEGILAMTGYSASEMTPELWETLEQEGFPRGALAHLSYEEANRITEEDASILWECDYRIHTRDGQPRWVADTSIKGYNENNEYAGVIGILQDITERKQSEQQIQQRLQELAVIHAISQAAASALEFDSLFDLVSNELFKLFDIQEIYFALHDQQTNGVQFPYYRLGSQRIETEPVPLGQGLSSRVILTREPILINQNYERRSAELGVVRFSRPKNSLNQVSWLGVPIRAGEQVIGMLCVMNLERENAFAQTDVALLTTIASNVGFAIQNAQLYMMAQQELAERKRVEVDLRKRESLLEAITISAEQFLKQPHWRKSINVVLERLGRELNASHAYLFEKHPGENGLLLSSLRYEWAAPGQTADIDNPDYQNMADHEIEYSRYYQTLDLGEPFVGSSSSFTDQEREYFASEGIKALLEMRITVNGRQWGTLGFDDLVNTREWTAMEVDVLKVAANVLGAAIKRRLDEETLKYELEERKRIQETLFEEKERAEVTLYSIGDAVITTDEQARVTYLNPVAENLIGWKVTEAVGQPLEKVFRIIEEGSRKNVINPVERCLQEGRIIGLANHSILISRDGTEYAIDDSAAPIRNRQMETIGVVLVFHDVTEERRLLQQIAYDAAHDSLTGLVNRREFEKRLEHALISVKERGLTHILCYLDMDQFKIVNDTAGHAAGDELLRQVANLLGGVLRQRDTFARLGGDEFGLLLENCQLDQALVVSNKVMTKIREYNFSWAGQNFQVGVSIGVVPINENTESIAQLLSQADIACYAAKDLGRDRIHVYETGDSETTRRYNEILQASRLRDAIINNQLRLYCQPILNFSSANAGFNHHEVLLRMMDTEDQLVMPDAFIPSAERYGLMPAIDHWVIRATLMAMSRQDTRGMRFSINLSGTSLDDETLLEYVLEQVREFSIPPERICFEITETSAIQHLNKAQKFIQAFREQGGKIALDDFGSGFSSFRYLKSLPVDYLKIDGSFVRDMLLNQSDQVMVKAITLIAHTLGIEVVAEHASKLEIIQVLREMGVEHAQGFGIGIPIPMEEIWGKHKQYRRKAI